MSATTTRPAPSHARPSRPPGRGGGGSLVWRVLRTEVLRSGPAAFVVVLAVLTAVVILVQRSQLPGWSSTFAGALARIDVTDSYFGPLAAALGAWVAGRERRRGMGDLLAATSRPAWQRVHLTWIAVAVGVVAGMLAQAVVSIAPGLPGTAYWGGRWVATLAVLVLGVVLYAAVGFAVGRALPGRLIAPLVGLVGFLGINVAAADPVVQRMWPIGGISLPDGQQLYAAVLALLAVWLLGLITAAVVLALGRRRVLALVPLAVAVIAAVPLVSTLASDTKPWKGPDPAAQAMVCTTDDGPQVCVMRVHAALLDDVAKLARGQISAAGPLVPWTSAQEEVLFTAILPRDVLTLPALDERGNAFRRGLGDPEGYLATSVDYQSRSGCYPAASPAAQAEQDAVTHRVDAVARALQTGSTQGLKAVPGARELHQRLAADPAAAKTWMTGYLAAAPECELPALTRLAGA